VRHDAAVREHSLDPAQLRAHRPVPQHPRATCVRRDRAAHRRAVLARDPDTKVEFWIRIRGLRQRDSGARRHLAAIGIHRTQSVQPGQAQHELAM